MSDSNKKAARRRPSRARCAAVYAAYFLAFGSGRVFQKRAAVFTKS